jgi:hypothetical protein
MLFGEHPVIAGIMLLGVQFVTGVVGPATHYQVDLTGTTDQVRLSGLPNSVCAHQVSGRPDRRTFLAVPTYQIYLIVMAGLRYPLEELIHQCIGTYLQGYYNVLLITKGGPPCRKSFQNLKLNVVYIFSTTNSSLIVIL